MARYFDGTQAQGNSATRTKRQQEDQRRMEFRRAIETYAEQRRLLQETGDDAEFNYWQAAPAGARQSARPAP
ncbi:PA3496 family putative envelope integrity protein [Pseudomonas rhizosphaerae]|jgi:hypothetical protein|uniref:PA3496 family putative envelope integrity protein n=1 Tax=Pseudomonas rhizosphaerae TaxID=216142 RepID=UPI002B4A5981|nr:hypothetical protein [Pseudomonas rhizosphaerae]MEB2870601.1 hypothetical protein [Pseudomonas rhizosphaerae]